MESTGSVSGDALQDGYFDYRSHALYTEYRLAAYARLCLCFRSNC
jgi:hypothetical protein